jgi:hypothetical protein
MVTGLKVDEKMYAEIVRLRREAHLGAEKIGKQLGLAKATVQKAFARMDAKAAHQGPAPMIEEVPLEAIHLEGDTSARVVIDSHIVNEYAEAMAEGATFPEVVLFREAEGYWIGDGHHRCRAAKQVDCRTIRAEVRAGGEREAFLYACSANATHGHRRNKLDARHAVILLLMDEEWRQWSDREIARRCAVSHPFVGKIRAAWDQQRARPSGNGYQIPETRTVQRAESVYTMDTAGIGARPEPPASAHGTPDPAAPAQGPGTAPPPTGTEGHWLDHLATVHGTLRVVLSAFDSESLAADMLRTWSAEHWQRLDERVDMMDARWQRFLTDYRAIRERVLHPGEAPGGLQA